MRLDVPGVLREAWAMAKRDRDVLLGLAGLLIFVPQFGTLLFMAPMPVFPGFGADKAALDTYNAASQAWVASYGAIMFVAVLLPIIAQIAITAFYVDPDRLTVGGALARVPVRFFPTLLALVIASPMGISLQIAPLLILPAAYLEGRLMLTLPILFSQRRRSSVFRAVGASWRQTAGHGMLAAGLVCITVIGSIFVAMPFVLLGKSLDGAPLRNPLVAAVLDGGAAASLALGAVATILVQVALYRRLSRGM